MECVILMGIQGAGKSSFYRDRFAETHVRINLDMLKTRHREHVLVAACLAGKIRFVVDNTNVTPDDRTRYVGPARAAGFHVVGYFLKSQVAACLERNEARAKPVPAVAVRGTRNRLVLPSLEEGFDRLLFVTPDSGSFSVEEWSREVR